MKLFEAHNASKKIDGNRILEEISLSISQGEKVAITGKNGSGKSSLLKLIGGIYEETAGQVKRAKMKTGYVPEHFPENIRFKLQDYLLLMGQMTSKSDKDIVNRIEHYAELFAVSDFLTTPLKKCSKGTKQKAGIIQALLKKPDLLLLDEPLTGLDDKAKLELMNQLNKLQEETIIFTAHDPLLIEELAGRVIIVENGRIVNDSSKVKKEKVRMIRAKIPTTEIMKGIPCIRYKFAENFTEIIVLSEESDKLLALLLEQGCSIVELTEKR